MAIDSQISAVLAARSPEPRHLLPIADLRANMLGRVKAAGTPVASVEDREIGSPTGNVRVRIYRPYGAPAGCIVYLHGGGFVMGSIETHDHVCRYICNEAGCIVVAPEYRLAPEHPFPAALDDCEAVLRQVTGEWNALGAPEDNILLAGDSAGGNLAAVLALRARDRGERKLKGQILIYPVTDAPRPFKDSYLAYGSNYSLTSEEMECYWRWYIGDVEDDRQWEISPLQADDFSGLPRSLVVTAEFDPLRDEGEAYAQRLADAGIPTKLIRYDGTVHGFIRMGNEIRLASKAIRQICFWIRDCLDPEPARPDQMDARAEG